MNTDGMPRLCLFRACEWIHEAFPAERVVLTYDTGRKGDLRYIKTLLRVFEDARGHHLLLAASNDVTDTHRLALTGTSSMSDTFLYTCERAEIGKIRKKRTIL